MFNQITEKHLRIYKAKNGKVPFLEWLERQRDIRATQRIRARIDRVRVGNFGDCRHVGGGIIELRIHHGPGYRIYFVMEGEIIVILLLGGDKGSQDEDIKKAKKYYEDLKESKESINY